MGSIRRAAGPSLEIECPNCKYNWEEKPPGSDVLKVTDLRSISRGSHRCRTKVYLTDNYEPAVLWLDFGEAKLVATHGPHSPKKWTLSSNLAHGTTDIEEDFGFALCLPIMALELDMVMGNNVFFKAIIDPQDSRDFRVPRPGYNPLLHPDTFICQEDACLNHAHGAHPIVPEGFWKPPHDYELFEAAKCRTIDIRLINQGIGNG